jgi:hypothetical protein
MRAFQTPSQNDGCPESGLEVPGSLYAATRRVVRNIIAIPAVNPGNVVHVNPDSPEGTVSVWSVEVLDVLTRTPSRLFKGGHVFPIVCLVATFEFFGQLQGFLPPGGGRLCRHHPDAGWSQVSPDPMHYLARMATATA